MEVKLVLAGVLNVRKAAQDGGVRTKSIARMMTLEILRSHKAAGRIG